MITTIETGKRKIRFFTFKSLKYFCTNNLFICKIFWLLNIFTWLEKVKTLWLFFWFSISKWRLVFPCTLTREISLLSILKVLLHNVHNAENCSLTTELIQLTWLSQSFLYDVLYLVIIPSILAELYYFSIFL